MEGGRSCDAQEESGALHIGGSMPIMSNADDRGGIFGNRWFMVQRMGAFESSLTTIR